MKIITRFLIFKKCRYLVCRIRIRKITEPDPGGRNNICETNLNKGECAGAVFSGGGFKVPFFKIFS